MLDYIIVGTGLAGIAFAETLSKEGKKFVVFDNQSQTSSRIAAGLYNPVILKRFSGMADAQLQLDCMEAFYSSLEKRLATRFNNPMPILRRFYSIEEQNNWFTASDKYTLKDFLSNEIVVNKFSGIDSPFGFGQVLQTGWVDTALLLDNYLADLHSNNMLRPEIFDYSSLQMAENHVEYKDISARNILFAEGFGMHQNPWFNYLPLDGTKGELLIIESDALKIDVVINSSIFILPLGNQRFKIGATYNWTEKDSIPTEAGKNELVEKINEVITCEYKIVGHEAGMRPTVKDRKPLLGTHPLHKRLHILNGLGTRGVMLGPLMSKILFEHIESGKPLQKEIDIRRFKVA